MPGLKRVKSSAVKAIAYNRKEKNLKVRFLSNGETINYIYHKVPINTYKEFMESESKGKFFAANIKDKFSYTKAETFLLSEAIGITIRPDDKIQMTHSDQTQ